MICSNNSEYAQNLFTILTNNPVGLPLIRPGMFVIYIIIGYTA